MLKCNAATTKECMALVKPAQLAKSGSEHGEQTALFAWAAVARLHGFAVAFAWADGADLPPAPETPALPALAWLHAIPNGGSRGDDERSRAIRGGNMKAEGARSGVADIFLPVPVYGMLAYAACVEVQETQWHGLYIEMKKPSLEPKKADAKGGLSDDQIAFRDFAKDQGYGWVVCYTWRSAAETIRAYMEWKA